MKYGASPRRGNRFDGTTNLFSQMFNQLWSNPDTKSAVGSFGNKLTSNFISEGFETDVGNGITNLGDKAGDLIGLVNPAWGMGVKIGSGIVGGIVNRGFGTKYNLENINAIKASNAAMKNANIGNGSTTEALQDFGKVDMGPNFAKSDVGEDGWWVNGASKLTKKLTDDQRLSRGMAMSNMRNASSTIASNQAGDSMARFNAFGGPLESNGLDEDYVNEYAKGGKIHIKKANRGKFTEAAHRAGYSDVQAYARHVLNDPHASATLKKRANFARNASRWHALGGDLFASGGSVATNGANFSQGYTNIGAGGTHETNQYDGVQYGVDYKGIPNRVEEGEVVWNNYVFSRRIPVPDELRKALKLGKKTVTFADAARKLGAGTKERPNDTIERKGQDAALERLMQAQEQVREAMRQQQMQQEAEQQQFMQMLTGQQQQQAYQDQMAQQQMAQDQLMQMAAAQQDQGIGAYACGGRMNRFDGGGVMANMFSGVDNLDEINAMKRQFDDEQYKIAEGQKAFDRWRRVMGIPSNARKIPFIDYHKSPSIYPYIEGLTNDYIVPQVRDLDIGYAPPSEIAEPQKVKTKSRRVKTSDRIDSIIDAERRGLTSIPQVRSKRFMKALDKARARAGLLDTDEDIIAAADQAIAAATRSASDVDKVLPDVVDNGTTSDNGLDVETGNENEGGTNGGGENRKAGNASKGIDWNKLMMLAPAYGSGLGVLTDALGITNNPDYANPRKIEDAARVAAGSYQPISPRFIGDYLPYTPVDMNYEANILGAQANAARRAAMYSGVNPAAANAMLGSLNYTAQTGLGNALLAANKANFDRRKEVAEFNRGTNFANSQLDAEAQKTNQAQRMQAGKAWYEGSLAGAALRDQIEERADKARSANLTGLFNNIGNVGRHIYDVNAIKSIPGNSYARGTWGGNVFFNGNNDGNGYGLLDESVFDPANWKWRPSGSNGTGAENGTRACGGYLTMRGRKRRR